MSLNGVTDADVLSAEGFAGRDACRDEGDPSLPRALKLDAFELPESLSSVVPFADADPERSDVDDMVCVARTKRPAWWARLQTS